MIESVGTVLQFVAGILVLGACGLGILAIKVCMDEIFDAVMRYFESG